MKFTDKELVERTLSGDKNAFETLVVKYQDIVYGLAFHKLGNFADAEDVTQEAFLKAYANLPTLQDKSKFAPWLRTITQNLCKMWLRSQNQKHLSFEITFSEEVPIGILATEQPLTPEESYEAKVMRESVMRAINSLSEKNRLMVTLFYLDGQSYQDIAQFLGLSTTAVQSQLQRARKQLKARLLSMAKEMFEFHKLPDDFSRKVLAETDALTVGELDIGRHEWGENVLSLRIFNKTSTTQWLGMDIRTVVKEKKHGTNWQRQFTYEIAPKETKTIRQPYNINRMLKDLVPFRGTGRCTLRLTFAHFNEETISNPNKYDYIFSNSFFSKTYELKIPSQAEAPGVEATPILPPQNAVSIKSIEVGQPQWGENIMQAQLINHTDKTQYLRVHIQTETEASENQSGPSWGAGYDYELKPKEEKEIYPKYHIYKGEKGCTVEAIFINWPENLPQLNWDGTGINMLVSYVADYPDAVVHKQSWTFK
jgi:RNA polymerase sigma-70 factor (ECF subfamily)